MSDITLTSGIRQNLLSLQQTSANLQTTQEALSTGKKVSSSIVEQVLSHCPVIQSAVVLGNQRKFLSAVIVPQWDKVQEFAAERNLPLLDLDSPEIHPEIAAWITEEIAKCSRELAEHERIKRFCLLPEEMLLDPEIVTPTQKLRRNAFESRYRYWIDRMYSDVVPFLITGRVMSAMSAQRPAGFQESHK